MPDLYYGQQPIAYQGVPLYYASSDSAASAPATGGGSLYYGSQPLAYRGTVISYGAPDGTTPVVVAPPVAITPPAVITPAQGGFVGATLDPPGSDGASGPRWNTTGPLFYVVEVDAYRPAGDGGAVLPIDTWSSLPWGALSALPIASESYDTLRASDLGYRTPPAGGTVTVYPPYLDTAFAIDRKINLDPAQSAAAAAWGSLALANPANRYDALAASENSDGRGVRVYVGSKVYDPVRGYFTDPPFASLRTLFVGIGQNWFCSDTSLSVPIRDATYFLERPVQTSLYGGGGGLDGGLDLAGLPKPRTRGVVRNITPILVDAVNRIYQWSDGPVASLDALREGGALTILAQGDAADLYSGTTASGYYRTCNAKGLFQLGTAPAHQITLDGTGATTPSMLVNSVIDLAQGLLLDDLAIPPTYVDTASFANAMTVTLRHAQAGYYLGTTAVDGATLLGQIVGSIAAKVFPRRDGRLALMVLRALSAAATPVATFSRDNAVTLTPTALGTPLDPPPWRFQVGYAHNYTVQTSDLGGSIAATQKQFVAISDRFSVALNNQVLVAYRRPSDPPQLVTMLANAADAQNVAAALVATWSGRRRLYALVVPVALGVVREIGDVISLVWPMDDLGGGRLGQIVGEQFRGGDATITLQVLV